MGLRSLFQRTAAKVPATQDPATAAGQNESPSPELLEELQEAWADLAEAAEGSDVTNLHACTRTGRHWMEDPATVRAIAATLREHPVLDG
jgi:hypothetical protein